MLKIILIVLCCIGISSCAHVNYHDKNAKAIDHTSKDISKTIVKTNKDINKTIRKTNQENNKTIKKISHDLNK